MARKIKVAGLVLLDIFIVNVAYIFVFLQRFNFDVESAQFDSWFAGYTANILPITLIPLVTYWALGLYRSLWAMSLNKELLRLAAGAWASQAFTSLLMRIIKQVMPNKIYLEVVLILFVVGAIFRLLFRLLRSKTPGARIEDAAEREAEARRRQVQRMLIVGIGEDAQKAAERIVLEKESNIRLAGFLAGKAEDAGPRLSGARVLATYADLHDVVEKHNVDTVLLALPPEDLYMLCDLVNEAAKEVRRVRIYPDREPGIFDILPLKDVSVDRRAVGDFVRGKVILITGAAGVEGWELCKQLASYRMRRLVLMDRSEARLMDMVPGVKGFASGVEVAAAVGSAENSEILSQTISKYTPHIIFHIEGSDISGVTGMENLMTAADEYAAEKLICLNPSAGSLQALKSRSAELKTTEAAACEYPEVMELRSSIVSDFLDKIENGSGIEVENREKLCEYITAAQAMGLVLDASTKLGRGDCAKLSADQKIAEYELAARLMRVSGYEPGKNMALNVVAEREKKFDSED